MSNTDSCQVAVPAGTLVVGRTLATDTILPATADFETAFEMNSVSNWFLPGGRSRKVSDTVVSGLVPVDS